MYYLNTVFLNLLDSLVVEHEPRMRGYEPTSPYEPTSNYRHNYQRKR